MAEKVTEMVLEVDLQCQRCYKKVKKVLCKFPQIRDQAYDEKKNVVKIKVFCCNPEKIRDKLCCKGGGSIKSIEIIKEKPPPPPPPPPPRPRRRPRPRPRDAVVMVMAMAMAMITGGTGAAALVGAANALVMKIQRLV